MIIRKITSIQNMQISRNSKMLTFHVDVKVVKKRPKFCINGLKFGFSSDSNFHLPLPWIPLRPQVISQLFAPTIYFIVVRFWQLFSGQIYFFIRHLIFFMVPNCVRHLFLRFALENIELFLYRYKRRDEWNFLRGSKCLLLENLSRYILILTEQEVMRTFCVFDTTSRCFSTMFSNILFYIFVKILLLITLM